MQKRILVALAAGVLVFATLFGLAATLSVGAADLAAGSSVVGSCDPDGVTTSYANAWDSTDSRYEVTSVTVNGIADACDGKTLGVSLTDSGNALLASGSVTVPTDVGTSATVGSLSPSDPAASAVTNVHVVIGD